MLLSSPASDPQRTTQKPLRLSYIQGLYQPYIVNIQVVIVYLRVISALYRIIEAYMSLASFIRAVVIANIVQHLPGNGRRKCEIGVRLETAETAQTKSQQHLTKLTISGACGLASLLSYIIEACMSRIS